MAGMMIKKLYQGENATTKNFGKKTYNTGRKTARNMIDPSK
jgi:hypothetical protein